MAACIANGAIGFLVPAVPFALVALIDGTLKITFGTWMFLTKREAAQHGLRPSAARAESRRG